MAPGKEPNPSVPREDLAEVRSLADICDQFQDAFVWIDELWRVRWVNAAAQAAGIARSTMIGQTLWSATPNVLDAESEVLARGAMAAREPFEADFSWAARRFVLRGLPLGSGLGLIFRETGAREVQEAAAGEDRARFREVAMEAPALLWLTRADRSVEFVNQAVLDFAGASSEAFLGSKTPFMRVHPDDLAEAAQRRAASYEQRRSQTFDARVANAAGEWRWLRFVSRPRVDENGRFLGFIGTALDVTELRKAELRQRLLVNELNHRVKNTLATVQSLARQTLRTGSETQAARDRFLDRLLLLSAAYNVLNRERWQGADLFEIATLTLRPYAEADQIQLLGRSVSLAPSVALAMAIALHELADNAARHGALSDPAGRVRVAWARRRGEPTVRLTWRERGGPPASKVERRGFGMRLLTDGLRGELGAPARLDVQEAGFSWTVTIPVQGAGGEMETGVGERQPD